MGSLIFQIRFTFILAQFYNMDDGTIIVIRAFRVHRKTRQIFKSSAERSIEMKKNVRYFYWKKRRTNREYNF